jgi:hypothetical protein
LHLDVTVGTKPVTKPAGKFLRVYSGIAGMRRCCMTRPTSSSKLMNSGVMYRNSDEDKKRRLSSDAVG